MNDKVLVVQLTGRMHHGAARGLHRGGHLAALVTDFHVPKWAWPLANIKPVLRSYCIELPPNKVFGNPLVGLKYRRDLKRYGHFRTATHIDASERLAKQAIGISEKVGASTIYAFDIQAIEVFRAFSGKARLVLEQCIAPRETQRHLLNQFADMYSSEEFKARSRQLDLLGQREEEEWHLADIIVCPSEFVRDELLKCGVPHEKVRMVPYGFSARTANPIQSSKRTLGKGLNAIFVGTVEPRKGLHDVVSAMELAGPGIQLQVYGSKANADVTNFSSQMCTFHGKVPFSTLENAYRKADVFVLPSYLEGSATVVYEAMSYGLPCIVTQETGSVVRDGIDGFVVPTGAPNVLADRLAVLRDRPDIRRKMAASAKLRSRDYGVEQYGERLCAIIESST